MKAKEAKARIKINKLLEAAGWRFFNDENGPANIQLEANVKLTKKQIDEYGDNFEKAKNGFVDFLLLDEDGKPFIMLEAKSEEFVPVLCRYTLPVVYPWSASLPQECRKSL